MKILLITRDSMKSHCNIKRSKKEQQGFDFLRGYKKYLLQIRFHKCLRTTQTGTVDYFV